MTIICATPWWCRTEGQNPEWVSTQCSPTKSNRYMCKPGVYGGITLQQVQVYLRTPKYIVIFTTTYWRLSGISQIPNTRHLPTRSPHQEKLSFSGLSIESLLTVMLYLYRIIHNFMQQRAPINVGKLLSGIF